MMSYERFYIASIPTGYGVNQEAGAATAGSSTFMLQFLDAGTIRLRKRLGSRALLLALVEVLLALTDRPPPTAATAAVHINLPASVTASRYPKTFLYFTPNLWYLMHLWMCAQ
jgi:hypothetical protein